MNTIFFLFRGFWRELICLKNKSIAAWQQLNRTQRIIFLVTLGGAIIGMSCGAFIVMSDVIYYNAVFPQAINSDFWTIAVLCIFSLGIMGAMFIWIIPVSVYGTYLFIKHTIKVGQA